MKRKPVAVQHKPAKRQRRSPAQRADIAIGRLMAQLADAKARVAVIEQAISGLAGKMRGDVRPAPVIRTMIEPAPYTLPEPAEETRLDDADGLGAGRWV